MYKLTKKKQNQEKETEQYIFSPVVPPLQKVKAKKDGGVCGAGRRQSESRCGGCKPGAKVHTRLSVPSVILSFRKTPPDLPLANSTSVLLGRLLRPASQRRDRVNKYSDATLCVCFLWRKNKTSKKLKSY